MPNLTTAVSKLYHLTDFHMGITAFGNIERIVRFGTNPFRLSLTILWSVLPAEIPLDLQEDEGSSRRISLTAWRTGGNRANCDTCRWPRPFSLLSSHICHLFVVVSKRRSVRCPAQVPASKKRPFQRNIAPRRSDSVHHTAV
jgi:hypothetical protein